jgi:predicted O-methyltransferase YrrM
MLTPTAVSNFVQMCLCHDEAVNAAVFNTMRILKGVNPGDTYLDNYLWHYKKQGNKFFDYYHLLWRIAPVLQPRYMLEIGCRTGISICQLLSALPDYEGRHVVLFDLFNDGFISPELIKVNLRHLNIPAEIVEFRAGDSLETVPRYIQSVDFKFDYVLVDGCHEKTVARKDLENVVSIVAPSGLLLFDDIAEDGCALVDVWRDFKKSHPDEFFFHENLNGKGLGVGIKK